MIKIVCISDTHEQHRDLKIPEGDILIHSGDFTYKGSLSACGDFNNWLGELEFKHKIIIAGNHELGFNRLSKEIKDNLFSNAIYLEDSGCQLEGINFWGSPRQPFFYDWEFNFPENDGGQVAKKIWKLIPENTNILITHGPPFGILDEVIRTYNSKENTGCPYLRRRIEKLDNLKYHIFGHIHEQYGVLQDEKITFINASILDDNYKITHEPVVFSYEI